MKIKNFLSTALIIIGFFISYGAVGGAEADYYYYYPFARLVALIFAGFMFIGMGVVLRRWE